jgi:PAS domain S-box-containing protein
VSQQPKPIPQPPILPVLLRSVILLALYFLAGLLFKKSALLFGQNNLLWPPAGLALAAILVFGYAYWPVIALGIYIFLVAGGVPPGWFMIFTVAGNTFIALAVGFLLKGILKCDNALERVWDVSGYLLVAGGLGVALNAAANVAGLACDHKIAWDALWSKAPIWVVPNALAVLVLPPFFGVWSARSLWRWNFRRAAEAFIGMAGLVASTVVAFNSWFLYGIHAYPLAYLPLPFLLWGGFRFGPRGAATGALVAMGMVIYFLLHGRGLFLTGEDLSGLWLLGAYMSVAAAANLLLAATAGERQRAELNLLENERRLRTVVADQSDLICRFLPDGKITFVNPAYCAFHGQPEAELLGTDFFQKLTPNEAAMLREKLAAPPEQHPVWSFDRRAVAADDHVEWQQYSFRQLTSDSGKRLEYQAVIQNITSRKQAELALQETKAALETMNLQLQIAAREANAAAAQANRANAAKSEFLANMSHEIRTPLSGILGMVELLSQSRLDSRQKEFADAAVESANSLLHVINDVLDFSKIEAGKMNIAQEEFSLRPIVDGVLENAATREPGKKINLAAIVRRNVPHQLVGDSTRLRQVLLNLVGNGIKFTSQGEVVVRVQPLTHTHGRIKLRFEVTDTGIGLSPEQTNKLFQPFTQADTSASRKFGGTGLGLAISRKIVELMGGRIGVHSTVGTGSTFWFELPFAVPPQPAIERSFPGLVFTQVLVAAPNASFRESLMERLRGWGIDCRELATAPELCRTIRHDLRATIMPVVLCDDEMLELGGANLRELLEKNQGRIQCILLAGPTATLGDEEKDLTQFASHLATVLLKPVREQSLFDALVNIVARHKPQALHAVRLPGDTEMVRRETAAKHSPIAHLRILAAEDHPFNRKLWQLMLDNFGVRAEWAEDGREAVNKFKPGKYDAILMDCNMPELDGHEATAAIRQLEAEKNISPRVRIIAITANALVGERERCIAAGMDDYLPKPFTSEQLYQALLAAVPKQKIPAKTFSPDPLEQLCSELGRPAVCEMTGDFLAELPDRLKEIHRLHAAGQWPELKRAAQSLKGLFTLYGFLPLAETLQAVVAAAGLADATSTGIALAGFDEAAEKAAGELSEWRQKQPVAS